MLSYILCYMLRYMLCCMLRYMLLLGTSCDPSLCSLGPNSVFRAGVVTMPSGGLGAAPQIGTQLVVFQVLIALKISVKYISVNYTSIDAR